MYCLLYPLTSKKIWHHGFEARIFAENLRESSLVSIQTGKVHTQLLPRMRNMNRGKYRFFARGSV